MFKILMVTITMYLTSVASVEAKDYNASLFGIKSDGVTLNTGSIQYAVDFISEQGGGRLMFYVGRYLTGTINLKSNVTIHLEEGAVLVGIPHIYNYFHNGDFVSVLYGEKLNNVAVTGKGVIMGNGLALGADRAEQIRNGYIQNSDKTVVPGLIQLQDCESVTLSGIILRNSLGDAIQLNQTSRVNIEKVTVENDGLPGSALTFKNNNQLAVSRCYFHTSGKEIIASGNNQNIRIEDTRNSTGKKLR